MPSALHFRGRYPAGAPAASGEQTAMTDDWIPFAEGEYLVENAWLVTPDDQAVALERAVVEVFRDRRGRRRLNGSGLIANALLVELLEDNDALDLLLDFGADLTFRLRRPDLSGGKVFAADVKSTLQFTPAGPLEALAPDEFQRIVRSLALLPR